MQIFYPRLGIQQVVDYLKRTVEGQGGQIRTGCTPTELRLEKDLITDVCYTDEEGQKTISPDQVFATIPIPQLVSLIRPPVPPEVSQAAEGLSFVAVRFLNLVVKNKNVFDATLTYFQDPRIPFNRVTSIRRLSEDCVPADQDVLCVEFTCTQDDALWNETEDRLYQIVMDVFRPLGLLNESDVAFYFSLKAPFAYPRFETGFEKKVNLIFSYLKAIKNLTLLGRQGLFCYANVDEVLAMSFAAADCARTSPSARYPYWSA